MVARGWKRARWALTLEEKGDKGALSLLREKADVMQVDPINTTEFRRVYEEIGVGWGSKESSVIKEAVVQSLGWEDPLEKGMATHSSIIAWRIPWTEEPGGL